MGNRTRDIPDAEWTDDKDPESNKNMCEGGACTFGKGKIMKRGVGDAYPDPRPFKPNT